jgi:hypothetical protein
LPVPSTPTPISVCKLWFKEREILYFFLPGLGDTDVIPLFLIFTLHFVSDRTLLDFGVCCVLRHMYLRMNFLAVS